jgi:hypothetical protein
MTPIIVDEIVAFSLPKKQNCTTTRRDMKKLTSFLGLRASFPLE